MPGEHPGYLPPPPPQALPNMEDWQRDYVEGTAHRIFEVPAPAALMGHDFQYVCDKMYSTAPHCVLIGLRSEADDGRIILNPRNSHTFAAGDALFVVAPGEGAVASTAAWMATEFRRFAATACADDPADLRMMELNALTWSGPQGPRGIAAAAGPYQYEAFLFEQGVMSIIDDIAPEALTFALARTPAPWQSVVVGRVPASLVDHVVVFGLPTNAVDFIMVLRSARLHARQPVLVPLAGKSPCLASSLTFALSRNSTLSVSLDLSLTLPRVSPSRSPFLSLSLSHSLIRTLFLILSSS